MAQFGSKRPGVANRHHYPKPKPELRAPGAARRGNHRELMTFDVVATHGSVSGSKKTALLQVKCHVRSIVATSYAEHGALSYYKGPQIMGNRATGVFRKGQTCKRWGSK
jgi:hypothetical protein